MTQAGPAVSGQTESCDGPSPAAAAATASVHSCAIRTAAEASVRLTPYWSSQEAPCQQPPASEGPALKGGRLGWQVGLPGTEPPSPGWAGPPEVPGQVKCSPRVTAEAKARVSLPCAGCPGDTCLSTDKPCPPDLISWRAAAHHTLLPRRNEHFLMGPIPSRPTQASRSSSCVGLHPCGLFNICTSPPLASRLSAHVKSPHLPDPGA